MPYQVCWGWTRWVDGWVWPETVEMDNSKSPAKAQKTHNNHFIFNDFIPSYSHSMVAGGFELMSYTTRLTPRTLLMISFETVAKNS